MSRQDLVVNELACNGKTLDTELATRLGTTVQNIQVSIHLINFNKKKYKEFTTLRTGKRGNYSRELSTRNSNENSILDGRDKKIKKGLKQFGGAKKDGLIGINTRQGIRNRNILVNGILNQNLSAMIEAQKLLQ